MLGALYAVQASKAHVCSVTVARQSGRSGIEFRSGGGWGHQAASLRCWNSCTHAHEVQRMPASRFDSRPSLQIARCAPDREAGQNCICPVAHGCYSMRSSSSWPRPSKAKEAETVSRRSIRHLFGRPNKSHPDFCRHAGGDQRMISTPNGNSAPPCCYAVKPRRRWYKRLRIIPSRS